MQLNSITHYTFGYDWMMKYCVGLQNANHGYKTVQVKPTIIPDLDRASGSFESPYGIVSNKWERKNGQITMTVEIPANSTAKVILPAGIKNILLEGKTILYSEKGIEIESGTYILNWIDE